MFRTGTTIATLSITIAFAILTSSLFLGVRSQVDERAGLLDGAIPGSIDLFSEFDITPDLSEGARDTLFTWLFITAVLVLLVAFFIVYNTMAIAVSERKKEIGILRAVGFSSGEVLRLFLIEGGFIGLVSWTIGFFFGMPLIVNLAAYLIARGDETFFFVQPVIDPPLLIASLFGSVAFCLLSTYLASYYEIRKAPVESMRGSGI
jgi:hypothetical protein